MKKNPGIVSDNPFKMPKVSRSDLSKNTVKPPIKGGRLTVVNSVPKGKVSGRKR